VKADGSRERRLTTGLGLYEYPAWSPDGKKIAFVRDRNIYVIDTTGGEGGRNQPRLLRITATLPGRPTDLAWSPDGTEIAFTILTAQASSWSVGKQDVYKMDADGSSVTRLTHARGMEWSPTWSPEDDQIAFFTKSLWIFVMDTDGPEPALLDKKSASITFENLENLYVEDLDWWGELPDSPRRPVQDHRGLLDGVVLLPTAALLLGASVLGYAVLRRRT
jgi:Tol biopolymer transport system component